MPSATSVHQTVADLRIVMLAPFGIRPKGTLLARMLPLAQALTRRGHLVSIVAPPVHNPEDAGRRDDYEGVAIIHTPLPTMASPLSALQQVAMLLRHVLMEQPDVIHLFKPKGYSGLAALLARMFRNETPLVVDTDDWEGWGGWNDLLPYPRAAKHFFAWQERDLPRRAAAVTVASRALETQVWGFGVPAARVVYLPNGVKSSEIHVEREAPEATTSNSETLHLLLYTRFWEFNLTYFMQALVAIVQRCPEAQLVVVGRGENGEERELLRLAERAGIARAINYRGWVAPDHIPSIIAAADLALVPMDDTLINRARGLAKLLELMAAGLPIVAGSVGQVAEYIEDGRSGMLVPPHDAAALARAALLLLSDADRRARLGGAARERIAQHYTWDLLAVQAERAYATSLQS